MMLWTVLFIAVFCLIFSALLILAPEGYEDRNGFHYGRPPPHQ